MQFVKSEITLAPELPEGIVDPKEVVVDEENKQIVVVVRFPFPTDEQIQQRFGRLETTKDKVVSKIFGKVRSTILPLTDENNNKMRLSATLSANIADAEPEEGEVG